MSSTGPAPQSAIASRFEHYVPQVYLRKFVSQGQGRSSIYCYDKFAGTSSMRNITNIAGARNFYEMPGFNMGGIETYLGRVESDFGPARDQLLASEDAESLSDEEMRALAYFAATQFIRTLEIRWLVRDLAAAIQESVAGEIVSSALRNEIEAAQREPSVQEVHLSMLKQVPAIAGNILEKKWITILNRTSMPFWTSDHPVNLRNEIEPPGLANIGVKVPGIQIYLPLSPSFSLVFCDFAYYMYMEDKLVATDVRNVVFQNDWQLRQSTQFVFSSVNDFSLARRITEDVPEIADPTRRRVTSSAGRRTRERRPARAKRRKPR